MDALHQAAEGGGGHLPAARGGGGGVLQQGAQLVQVPGGDGKPGRFPDVKEGSWYAGAVSAMADMGFISGYGDGRFGPDDTISYQEMVAILSKVAAWASMDGYYLNQDPLTLQDALTYAAMAQNWARVTESPGWNRPSS